MRKILIACAAMLIIAGMVARGTPVQPALAQTGEVIWNEPVNLSQSGATSDPSMIVDNDGVFHVVWIDLYDGSVYSENDGSGWSTPRAIEYPFNNFKPVFIKDDRGFISAFWLDADHTLLTSYARQADFGLLDGWSAEQTLAESVLDFDAEVDASGRQHVVYMRTETDSTQQAGIYHRSSTSIGFIWANPVQLYESSYFRALEEGGGHIELATTRVDENDLIYVAWDNRTLKRVYLDRSMDGGATWEAPYLVDSPSDDTPTVAPFHIIVSANGENVDLIWQSGLQSGFDCTQTFQHSMDMGQTWGEKQTILQDLVGCPQSNQLFNAANNLTILMTTIEEQVYLLAWDGKNWSMPQAQGILSSFVDAQSFDTVNFRCQQANLVNGVDFYVVGCDTVGDGDIWLVSRQFGDVATWFPPADEWSDPVVLATDRGTIYNVQVLPDPQGRLHVFWTQPDENIPSRNAVQYARLDEEGWHPAVRIFSTPDNRAGRPSVAIDTSGRLAAVWASTSSGELFFSWADPAAANNPFEWAAPLPLPILQKSAIDPVIALGPGGTLYVAYALQLNEQRGIYLISSNDGGETWSEPVVVFDAQSAGWSMLQDPRLKIATDGSIYVIWERSSLPEDVGVIGLFYSRSLDGGKTWSPSESIVDANISWGDIGLYGGLDLYRFWQGDVNETIGIYFDHTTNGGDSWELPQNLTRVGEILGPTALISDPQGGLHLVQVLERESERKVILNHWQLGDLNWNVAKSLELRDTSLSEVNAIDAAVVGSRLAVVYLMSEKPIDGGVAQMSLIYTGRGLDALAEAKPLSEPRQIVVSTEEAPQTAGTPEAATATPEAGAVAPAAQTTPTIAGASSVKTPPGGAVQLPGGAWGGLALGTGVAVAIVVITFGLAIRRTRRVQ